MANNVVGVLGGALIAIGFILLISGSKNIYSNQVTFDQTGINLAVIALLAIGGYLIFLSGRKVFPA